MESLQNLRELQTMQHFQSLNQPPEFIKVSNGEVAFLFRHHLLLHPGGAGFWLPSPSVRLCRWGGVRVSTPAAVHLKTRTGGVTLRRGLSRSFRRARAIRSRGATGSLGHRRAAVSEHPRGGK